MRFTALLVVVYGVILAVLYFEADESPVATLFLFGPRWIAALPFTVLLPLAVYTRSRLVLALTVGLSLVVAGPITGGRISAGRLFDSDRPALQRIRVVSWNMAGKRSLPLFRQSLEEFDPTLLVCQEANLSEDDLPTGWKLFGRGGVRVATRLTLRPEGSIDLASVGAPGIADRYVVETQDGVFRLVNVHLPTPRPGIEAAIASKGCDLSELRRIIEIRAEASRVLRRWSIEQGGSTVVAGDFNMPVESRIYRQNWADFRNAFSESGSGWGSTKQTSWFGTRIDHVLYTPPWRCRKAWVGSAMGSDHRPMIADLEWTDSVD